jgi:hypothetical protein
MLRLLYLLRNAIRFNYGFLTVSKQGHRSLLLDQPKFCRYSCLYK